MCDAEFEPENRPIGCPCGPGRTALHRYGERQSAWRPPSVQDREVRARLQAICGP